jgi:hypothetical protein
MTEDEYPELLRYVRSRIGEIGRADLDEFAYTAVEAADRPSDALLGYLSFVLTQIVLESQEGVLRAQERLNHALAMTDGGRVDDLILLPTDVEQAAINREQVSLFRVLPRRADFIVALQQFYDDVVRDRNEPHR